MADSLFKPQFHDNVTGIQVGVMTVHRDGRVFFGENSPSTNTVVVGVYANYNKAGQQVRLDVKCSGDIPNWLGERHRQTMLHTMVQNRREMEKQYHIRMEEKITGKMRRYNRLA